MKALITGGAGFIGSHLADALLAQNHEVVVVDDLSTGSLDNVAHLQSRPEFQLACGSVCDDSFMPRLVRDCDVVFHLAAAVGVKLIVQEPVRTLHSNIHGTETVLELASRYNKRVLLTSTSEVYGKSNDIPFREKADCVLGSTQFSRWSYACSKMVDEFLALAYREQFGLEVVICRLFNTIGPRQSGEYGMVVPRFVRRALAGEPLEIFGTGEQIRCFSNVRDIVRGLMALMQCEAALGEVVNLGSTESITIKALAAKVLALTGSKSPVKYLTYDEAYGRPFDDMLARLPDLTQARRLINYAPTVSLDDTLREVIEFERKKLSRM